MWHILLYVYINKYIHERTRIHTDTYAGVLKTWSRSKVHTDKNTSTHTKRDNVLAHILKLNYVRVSMRTVSSDQHHLEIHAHVLAYITLTVHHTLRIELKKSQLMAVTVFTLGSAIWSRDFLLHHAVSLSFSAANISLHPSLRCLDWTKKSYLTVWLLNVP